MSESYNAGQTPETTDETAEVGTTDRAEIIVTKENAAKIIATAIDMTEIADVANFRKKLSPEWQTMFDAKNEADQIRWVALANLPEK